MNTIYWITRLDGIVITSWILFAISISFVLIGIIEAYLIDLLDDEVKERTKVLFKVFTPIAIITLLLTLFVPTTKEAIVIYGGGKILNYVESNEKLQNMPDKVVELTDEYIDTLNRKLNSVENKEEQ